MHNIDVHIAIHPKQDRSSNLDNILSKLEDEPVNVHLLTGIDKHIGQTRVEGFSMGSAPIVTYIDDDDDFIPGIFSKIQKSFDDMPDIKALCTWEEKVYEEGSNRIARLPYKYLDPWHFACIHHLACFKRESINTYLGDISKMPNGAERSLWAMFLLDGNLAYNLPELGYRWRVYEGNAINHGRTFIDLNRELERACWDYGKRCSRVSQNPLQELMIPQNWTSKVLKR